MAKVDWPAAESRKSNGKPIDRSDGPSKVTGAAKYSYDINRPGMLWAKVVTSPYAHAEVTGIDTSAAEALPGVKGVWRDTEKEVRYAGEIVAAVAAVTEEIAEEAARLVKVQYKPLDHQVVDTDAALSRDKPSKKDQGNVDDAFTKADQVVEGEYGIPVVSHCCLESHGQVTEVRDGELYVWPSTQNVSRYSDRLGEAVGIDQNKIHVECQFMGGGFGSKFNFDKWGPIGALLSKQTGKPVKLLLERDIELMTAGNRPSAYAKIKVGAQKDGTITAVEAEVWGTGGMGGYGPPPIPYVFTKVPHTRVTGKGIRTNRGGQRAWRAPNHPQGCFLTMSALADTAAALKMDELEFFLKNVSLTDRAEVYTEELKIAADLIDYKRKAHPRGDPTPGPVKRGLGMSIHTWGGMGHPSECDVTISPDGSVDARRGSNNPGESQKMHLMDGGVGGAQIADVSVDIETGIVTINEMVAAQDCGLIIDLKTAESQVYGALIMGITYSLFEEAVYDAKTGRMLNADMEFYRLAGIKDVGKLKVHMMTGKGYDDRGVIGLGEPPVISPGAAIGNAVANAIGVRAPHLPLTPDRVLAVLQKGGATA